jgi:hypothetical protein
MKGARRFLGRFLAILFLLTLAFHFGHLFGHSGKAETSGFAVHAGDAKENVIIGWSLGGTMKLEKWKSLSPEKKAIAADELISRISQVCVEQSCQNIAFRALTNGEDIFVFFRCIGEEI